MAASFLSDPPKSPAAVSRFQCMPELELDTVFERPSEDDLSSQPPSASSQAEPEKVESIDDKEAEVANLSLKEPFLAPPPPAAVIRAPKKTVKMVESKATSVAI